MITVSLSDLFNSQIESVGKIDAVRIAASIKRVGRMIDGLDHYSLDVAQMTLKVRVGKRLGVVVKAIPPNKIIAKKIVRK